MEASRLLYHLFVSIFLPPVNLAILGLLGLLLAKRQRRTGMLLIAAAILGPLVLSLPWTANALLRLMETPYRALSADAADAIVVLGGGIELTAPEFGPGGTLHARTLERVRYGAHLYRAFHKPVLVTGGAPLGGTAEAPLMRQSLEQEFGVPVTWEEDRAQDTRENADYSYRLLAAAGIHRIFLVSHSWHLPRAREVFESAGFTVVPAGTGFRPDRPAIAQDFIPSPTAFANSYYAFHEWIGRFWYRVRP